MQTTLNIDFSINRIAYLQADLRKAEEKIKKQNLSLRAYKGWAKKRKDINNSCK